MIVRLSPVRSAVFRERDHSLNVPPSAQVAPSFNGRTADSGSAYRGSNPWGAANLPPILVISHHSTASCCTLGPSISVVYRPIPRGIRRPRAGQDRRLIERQPLGA